MNRLIKSASVLTIVLGVTVLGCESNQSAAEPAAAAPAKKAIAEATEHNKPGFKTYISPKDGRLWVFRDGADDHKEFLAKGEPARQVLRPGAGPDGITLKASETETITEYLATKPGFSVYTDKRDGRLWVFRTGTEDHKAFHEKGPSARQVLRPAAGPGGITLKSTESETITEYLATRPGFAVFTDKKDGRLWVFPDGSADLSAFLEKGPSARQVLRPAAGPGGVTLKSTESEHIEAYLAAAN